MRVVVQRVTHAQCTIDGKVVGRIGRGLLLLVGVTHTDTEDDVRYITKKVAQLRVFSDQDGKMNLALKDINGAILSISQFTLYADTKHGNRPSFINAARPELAQPLYDKLNEIFRADYGLIVETGCFGADMKLDFVNDGPVTIIIDSQQ